MVASQETGRALWPPIAIVIGALLVLAAGAFVVASIVHFGIVIPLGLLTLDDPFPGAAIPEAILALVLAIGALAVLTRRPRRWGVALATALFALLVTIYGLTVTVGAARTGDIAYHVSVLVVLVLIVGLLLLPQGRRALSG